MANYQDFTVKKQASKNMMSQVDATVVKIKEKFIKGNNTYIQILQTFD